MNSKLNRSFNSKILLFGEYSLMKGSMALSIPFDKFSGNLAFESDSNKCEKHFSRPYLIYYLKFLKENNLDSLINIKKFEKDISKGLVFECNIPISYGLGSSGAIVASIYNAYSKKRTSNLLELKRIFSAMESFYHGQSSGLDPLVSYHNKAILIDEFGVLKEMETPKLTKNNGEGIFLLDTETKSETQPLVDWFLTKYETHEFHEFVQNKLITANNNCIVNFLKGDLSTIFDCVKNVSEYTFDQFKPMIPDSVKEIWYSGLMNDDYYLKLCGSGGGGMLLGFTKNISQALEKLKDYKIHMLDI